MPQYRLSRHAEVRANQRGVTHGMIEALISLADIDEPIGDGCCVLRISRRSLQGDRMRLVLGDQYDRLSGLALVWSEERAEVVTVLHDHGRRGRRYRRPH